MVNNNDHKFWSTQPVGNGESNDIIQKPSHTAKDPIKLPNNMYFTSLKPEDISIIHNLLSNSYVEDENSFYRLNYSLEFLEWQMNNLSHKDEYLLGVRDGDALCAFSFGREHVICLNGVSKRVISVNFLCIVKEKRNKGLAPLIIKEMTRRANCNEIYQAVFTGGIKLPFKIASVRYFHRIINKEKLCMLGFCDESQKKIEVSSQAHDYKFRLIQENDFEDVWNLYKKECKKCKLFEVFSLDEFKYNFRTRNGVIYTFVYEKNGFIHEYGSFYILNTLVIEKKAIIKTAYLYYYSYNEKVNIVDDLISYAESLGMDLFNSLEIMNTNSFLKELNFHSGDGILNYYLFNWEASSISNDELYLLLP